VGANGQVIFNDGGVLAGDPQFLWNKTANLLTVTGTATITGDLTVDTSTLKVDSASNRVGIGTASPLAPFHVNGTDTTNALINGVSKGVRFAFNSSQSSITGVDNTGAASFQPLSIGGSTLDFSLSGTTAMTLNSTGLGVGATPSNYRLYVSAAFASGLNGAYIESGEFNKKSLVVNHTNSGVTSNLFEVQKVGTAQFLVDSAGNVGVGVVPSANLDVGLTGAGTPRFRITSAFDNPIAEWQRYTGTGSDYYGYRISGGLGNLAFQNSNQAAIGSQTFTTRMLIDSSGNVGVGVTPSAWNSSYRALQIGATGALWQSASGFTFLSDNAFVNSGASNTYITTAAASFYRQNAGVHTWWNAPSGTAGNAITFTQAMTLDASGRLLVGKAASNFATVGSEIKANGSFTSTQSDSTNGSTAWDTYSTGASAYRFYVGMAGTVFATNTTISAISDARFKENIQDLDVGLGAILALKPRKFDWKAGKGKDIKGDRGFIAQEFEQVFPQLVDEWRDNAPEGEAPYKSVRQDLIPVLVKAIQELTARVEALEA
jgi:hypothetical protein